MWSRWSAVAVWGLAAASVVFWALRLFVQPAQAPAQTTLVSAQGPLRGDLTRLLGEDPPPERPPEVAEAPVLIDDGRFQLLGVVSPRAPRAAREGLALIAVDGQPPRAYRVGAAVSGDTVLQSVAHNRATLGPRGGTAGITLELAPPAPAATGTLPPAVGSFAPPAFAPPPGLPPGGFPRPATRMGAPVQTFQPPQTQYNTPQQAYQVPQAPATETSDEQQTHNDGTPLR